MNETRSSFIEKQQQQNGQITYWTDKEKSEKTQITSIKNEMGTNPTDMERIIREYVSNFIAMDMITSYKMDKYFASTSHKSSLEKLYL